MRPIFHPSLVNGRYGDPTVYVETLFKSTVCCSISEKSLHCRRGRYDASIRSSSRMRISIISLASIICSVCSWDSEKTVHLYGPAGFAERVFHKLQAYRWNLVESYPCDLVFVVSELETPNSISTKQFRLKRAFAAEPPVSKHNP